MGNPQTSGWNPHRRPGHTLHSQGKWVASVRRLIRHGGDGGTEHLGTFDDEISAARAYDARAGDDDVGDGALVRRGRAISGTLTLTRAIASGEEEGTTTRTETARGDADGDGAEEEKRRREREIFERIRRGGDVDARERDAGHGGRCGRAATVATISVRVTTRAVAVAVAVARHDARMGVRIDENCNFGFFMNVYDFS